MLAFSLNYNHYL
jgi:hypothetical protein